MACCRVYEANIKIFSPFPGFLINEPYSLAVKYFQMAVQIFHGKGDMMDTLTFLFNEF